MEKKEFNIPAIGIVDNIVITKDETWAYYIIAEHPYLFLDMQGRANFFIETINTLGELARNGNKIMDCHLLISNQEIDTLLIMIVALEEDLRTILENKLQN